MRRIYLLLPVMLGLAGCATEEQTPQIVYEVPSTITTPKVTPTLPTFPAAPSGAAPRAWVPSRTERAWSAIIIHHSATDAANAAIIDKWHRDNGWNGIGYDFVIGNGTNSGDGEVEPTYRWRGQLTGAHCGGTPGNWANEEGIGICLVGDFNRTTPTARQMDSLVRLVRFLQQRYGIPKSRIYGHGSTPGGHSTDCPGRRFPMSWLKSNL
ncbi:MAG: peptidoglycan recognition family protein [Sedimentisphaerales bacterium]|jgi:hypothetical protein